MKPNQKIWMFKKKIQEFFASKELKTNTRIVKGAILSILAGFIVAGIVIAIQNVNPFEYFVNLFKIAFNPLYISQTLQWLAVYIIAGLSVAVGFKTGLFNIGVAGQMLSGAAIGTIIFNLATPNAQTMSGGLIFLIFIVCVAMGTAMATIAGWLKAMFNIHEVVSTIMLNWIAWYFFKFIFLRWSKEFTANGIATNPFPSGMLDWGGNQVILPIIIALTCVFVIWLIFTKTVFGFKLKSVGSSTTVSKYAGINVKNKIIASMAISGALAGVASFVSIFTISPNIYFGVDNLPTTGYDAIAVALVAFNNPLGIVGVSLLWGIAQSAGASAASLFDMPSQMSLLIFGFIVYFAAISIVFIKWMPWYSIKLRYYIWNSKLHKFKVGELQKQILQNRWWIYEPGKNPDYKKQMQEFKNKLKVAQTEVESKKIKQEIKDYKFDFKETCRLNLKKYENKLKNYKTNLYIQEINRGMEGAKHRASQRLIEANRNALDNINLLRLDNIKVQDYFKNLMENVVKKNQKTLRKEELDFKKAKKALKVWKQGALGDLRLVFELRNGKIALKGEYHKQKNLLKEEIKNVRSDQRLQFHLLRFDESLSNEAKNTQKQQIILATKEKIAKINQQIKVQKNKMLVSIDDLKVKKQQRAQKLKQNKTPILAIEKKYQDQLAKLTFDHQHKIAEIKKNETQRCANFDWTKSEQDIHQARAIVMQTKTRLKNADSKPKSLATKIMVVNNKNLEVQEAVAKIYKLFGRDCFKEYDNNQAVRQKTKILLTFAQLEYQYQVESEILKTQEILSSIKKQNNQIIQDYENNLDQFKVEYKKMTQDTKTKMSKDDPNYLTTLIENEQAYITKINDYLNKLEIKYLNGGGK